MKKQAVAFFTMFSLIMMLAIYYITLPEKDAKITSKEVDVMAKLNKKTKENKNIEKEKNDDIISDSEADEASKNEAIVENEMIKENEKLQNDCMNAIKEAGYESHVEIKEKTAYITILNQKEQKDIVNSVIKSAYPLLKNNYFIEVCFK